MALNILVADPQDILRTRLRTIFITDKRIAHAYEAATAEEISVYLRSRHLDLVVVNQLLVRDITALPHGRFIILTPKFDMVMFQAAYRGGSRGYLLENTSAELLREAVDMPGGAFLIEPAMVTQILEYLCSDPRFMVKEELLTPREREIIALLRRGVNRPTIAKQLSISEATLKTHIKNIARKREHISLSLPEPAMC